jgi:hypothetical protein
MILTLSEGLEAVGFSSGVWQSSWKFWFGVFNANTATVDTIS